MNADDGDLIRHLRSSAANHSEKFTGAATLEREEITLSNSQSDSPRRTSVSMNLRQELESHLKGAD